MLQLLCDSCGKTQPLEDFPGGRLPSLWLAVLIDDPSPEPVRKPDEDSIPSVSVYRLVGIQEAMQVDHAEFGFLHFCSLPCLTQRLERWIEPMIPRLKGA